MQSSVHARTDCRLCGSTRLSEAFSFGETPLANNYLLADELSKPEIFAPLTVNQCDSCKLVQLRDVVDPSVLFSHYLYVSGTSPVFVAHFSEYAKTLVERFKLSSASLVVDVGSNDGVLLARFKEHGVKILGVDPAQNIAADATARGIPTLAEFFTTDTAQRIQTEHGAASVITANNVFAHTDDIMDFVEAFKEVLAADGVFVFEVQYLKDMIEKNLFDMVYHEHLCYYHLTPLTKFFEHVGMRLFDVEHVSTHGGSIRVYVCRAEAPHQTSPRVAEMLAYESSLNTIATYQAFAARIAAVGKSLRDMVEEYQRAGKRIAGYGAPAKATTLCYAFGLTASHIDFIVDDSPLKQGRFMPGTHIPIKSSSVLLAERPDYCLILAWNFAESIVKNNRAYVDVGGTFIAPLPEPHLLN